jgi:hypothetical protein
MVASSAAGWSSAPFSGSDETGVSPKDFENLAETVATFVTLASIQLAVRWLAQAQAGGLQRVGLPSFARTRRFLPFA